MKVLIMQGMGFRRLCGVCSDVLVGVVVNCCQVVRRWRVECAK